MEKVQRSSQDMRPRAYGIMSGLYLLLLWAVWCIVSPEIVGGR